MDHLKRLKLFPDGWYRKLSKREMEVSRQQLKAYTVAKEIDTSLKEVINVLLIRDK